MRRRLSRMLCLVLAMALAGSLSIAASAAETATPLLSLTGPSTAIVGTEVEVLINVSEPDRVADARLTVTFNSALAFSEAKLGSAWSNQEDVRLEANAQKDGEVSVAFAGVDAAGAGDVVRLVFIAMTTGKAEVSFDTEDSYVTGVPAPTFGSEFSVNVSESTPPPPPTPSYPEIPSNPVTYNVTVIGGSGSGAYSAGTTVTITADDHSGTFKGWTTEDVTLADASSVRTTFVMPAHDVTVTASWELSAGEVMSKFDDVDYPEESEYAKAITYVVNSGIMRGTSGTTFEPDAVMSRDMLVTMLYRMSGSPKVSGESPFLDVSPNEYYYDAVIWAYTNGITRGTSSTTFSPSGILTRQEIATFLYRYADLNGLDEGEREQLAGYTDASSVSDWAGEAMQWAVGAGIIRGTSDVTLSPAANATRIQMALMICRLLEG